MPKIGTIQEKLRTHHVKGNAGPPREIKKICQYLQEVTGSLIN